MSIGIRLLSCIFFLGAMVFSASAARAAYWKVFNIEGESAISADIVTYASLADMLADTNRTGTFTPSSFGAGYNLVGSGSDVMRVGRVPEPGTLALLALCLVGLAPYMRARAVIAKAS